MPIIVNLDQILIKRGVKSKELARAIGISEVNLSLLKSGKVKGVRFATLAAICEYLECKPGDILDHEVSADGTELRMMPESILKS
jgi:putative transcriptional regulator